MQASLKLQLPYVIQDTDRHGNRRVYVRRKGLPKVRLHAVPGTSEFLQEYKLALETKPEWSRPQIHSVASGSFRATLNAYYRSAEYLQLGGGTRRVRRLILDGICEGQTYLGHYRAELQFAEMERQDIREVRDEKAGLPGAANGRIKALRHLFAWAEEVGRVKANLALEVPYLKSGSDGFHTWTIEEIEQFEAKHPIGTKARLAFALLLFTGVRRSDVVKLGKGMERDKKLHFSVTKGATRKGKPGQPAPGPKRIALPIHPQLREILDASPGGHMTYLVNELGRPFTVAGFGNKFRDWCNEAGLQNCSAHGVRKAAAVLVAESGATANQMMAMFGWEAMHQAELYTRGASQEKLAAGAMHLFVSTPRTNRK